MTFYIPETQVINGSGSGAFALALDLETPTPAFPIQTAPVYTHWLAATVNVPIEAVKYDSPASLPASVSLNAPTLVLYSPPVWSETRPSGIDSIQDWFNSFAISEDGNIQLAHYAWYGAARLYITRDRAVTWSEVQPAGDASKQWQKCSMSKNGQYIVANHRNLGRMYLSTDSGYNWNELQPNGNVTYSWICSAISDNGQVILAAVDNGRLWLTTNGGASWTEQQPAGAVNKYWLCVGVDSDGSALVACVGGGGSGGRVYHSTNGGTTWVQRQPMGNVDNYWRSVAMNSDGSIIYIAGNPIYRSTNSGVSWTSIGGADVKQLGCSTNGQSVIMGNNNGRLYFSTNQGTTWVEQQPAGAVNKNWCATAVSGNGNVRLAGATSGRMYIYK